MNLTEMFGRLHEWSKARQVASLTRRGIAVPASLLPAGAVPPTPPSPMITQPLIRIPPPPSPAGGPVVLPPILPPPTASPNPTGSGGTPPLATTATAPVAAVAIVTTPPPAPKTKWWETNRLNKSLGIVVILGILAWIYFSGEEPSVEVNMGINPHPPEVVIVKTLPTFEPVTENILDEYVDPKKWVGGELTTTKFVKAGNGKHFIKPEGWSLGCTVWAHAHDGSEYSRLINVGSMENPKWISDDSTNIVSARGFWVRYKGEANKLPPEGMKVTFTLTPRMSP